MSMIKNALRTVLILISIHCTIFCQAQQQTDAIAENMLLYQRNYGGWPKALDNKKVVYEKVLTEAEKTAVLATSTNNDATIDNKATSREIVYLMKAYSKTGNQQYLDAAKRGIDYILKAQYDNGGWPQYYPDKSSYRTQITFNDDAIVNVLNILFDMAHGAGDYKILGNEYFSKAQSAVDRGIACILKTQYVSHGQLTAWAAQYDPKTFVPAKARAYELPSLASAESCGIVKFLMRIENPSNEVKAAVKAAKEWFEKVKIVGFKTQRIEAPSEPTGKDVVLVADASSIIWARFYTLETMQPMFCGRNGIPTKTLAEIDNERRTGYAWYGGWANDLLDKKYIAWAKTNGVEI